MAGTKTATNNKQTHFVLVHGACHGAWCWYKLKPLLETAGHRVTAIDMTASGINTTKIQDVYTLEEYTKPLLELLAATPDGEKVILVGHSLGGLNLALAMERFPSKVAVGVYLTACMPDTSNKPSFVWNKYMEKFPAEVWLDTQFAPYSVSQQHLISLSLGPMLLEKKLYQNCPIEDLELAKTLLRPGSLFLYDLENSKNFSEEGYGSVPRAYILCDEDQGIPVEFQRWMIENYAAQEVMELKGADHMAMLSKPHELCLCLSQIALRHAE